MYSVWMEKELRKNKRIREKCEKKDWEWAAREKKEQEMGR